jgi:hypothetical protein
MKILATGLWSIYSQPGCVLGFGVTVMSGIKKKPSSLAELTS